MALTPKEIDEKEFLVGLRGYDKDEVRKYLKMVAAELAHALEASTAAPVAEPAAPATDWSSVGDEIAAVLKTAHEQAATLRGEAEHEVRELRAQAQQDAEARRAEAEAKHAEAEERVSTAQTEALNLVAEAQSRVDRMIETSKIKAKEEAEAAIADLTRQIEELTKVRAESLATLKTINEGISSTLAEISD